MKHPRNMLSILFKILLILVGFVVLIFVGLVVAFRIVDKTNGTLISSGEKRSYLLYVPQSYDASKPTPLVIAIHGFMEWPAHEALISHWNEVADENGFIVVYPSGTKFPKRWRASGVTSEVSYPLIDVRFISDLIDKLESQYNIDPARIYANGLSNGGGMSYLLSCALSDRIAAIGGVSGAYLYPPGDCKPVRPVPFIAFHGTADPIVPFDGGPSRSFNVPFPYIPDFIKNYAASNKCAALPQVIPSKGDDISGIQYSDCAQNADVIFYTIAGGGHSWPGGDPIPAWIVGRTSQSIDATRVIWEFFKNHALQ
jgi:polyhydroxybutyrate depolymerase